MCRDNNVLLSDATAKSTKVVLRVTPAKHPRVVEQTMLRRILTCTLLVLALSPSCIGDSALKQKWKEVTQAHGEWGYGYLNERRGQICDTYRQWGASEIVEDVWPGCTVLFVADPDDKYDLSTVAEGEQDNFLNTQHYKAAWNLHGEGFLGNSLPRPGKDIDPTCLIANVDGQLVLGYEEGEGDKLLPCPGHRTGAPFPTEWILEGLNGTRDLEDMCSQCYQSVCSGIGRTRARDCGSDNEGGVDLEEDAILVKQAQPIYHCHMTMADEGACDYVQYVQHESSRDYYMDYSITCGWQNIQYLNITFCDCTRRAGQANGCAKYEAMEMAYAGVVCGNCNNGFNEDKAFLSIFSPYQDEHSYDGQCGKYRTSPEGLGKNYSKMMCSKGIWCPDDYNGGANCQFHCDNFGVGSETAVDLGCGDYPNFPQELCTSSGKCFYVPDVNRRSWQQAENHCQSLGPGSHLASIASEEENSLVHRLSVNSGNDELWIGYEDASTEGVWSWSDGSAAAYTNWADGEPNNAGNNEDCAEFKRASGGRWNDQTCSNSHHFVCAKQGPFTSGRRLMSVEDGARVPREITLDTRFDWGHVQSEVKATAYARTLESSRRRG